MRRATRTDAVSRLVLRPQPRVAPVSSTYSVARAASTAQPTHAAPPPKQPRCAASSQFRPSHACEHVHSPLRPHTPWRPPLETCAHWERLPAGGKLLIYHAADRVIGRDAALHTELERRGALEGTAVIQLRGQPEDAHNEDPGAFSPHEWAQAVRWMKAALGLLEEASLRRSSARARSSSRV